MNVLAAWNQFWFAPQSTSTLALVRIAYGILMVGWTVSVLPDIATWYSSEGVAPTQTSDRTPLTLLGWWDSPAVVAVLWAVLLLAAVCLTLGARTRVAALVLLVALISLHRRNPDTNNGGDVVLRVLAFYMVLAPAGAAFSLDRWRRHRDAFWESPRRAPWALRLIQVQVSVLYLASVFYKVQGDTWSDGTAYGYIAQLTDVQRLPVPGFVLDSMILVNLLTYGTLAVELALAVLVWNRKALPWVMAVGVALHLGIEITMTLGFFALGVFVSYISFLPPDVGDRAISWIRRQVVRRKPQRKTSAAATAR